MSSFYYFNLAINSIYNLRNIYHIHIKIFNMSCRRRNIVNTKDVFANRILELCSEREITVNKLANISGIPPMTVYSILNSKSKNPGIVNIKKLCDGFEITLGEFFSTEEFDKLEQEVK